LGVVRWILVVACSAISFALSHPYRWTATYAAGIAALEKLVKQYAPSLL
jgi:hypothetical protein